MNTVNAINQVKAKRTSSNQKTSDGNNQSDFRNVMNKNAKENQEPEPGKASLSGTEKRPEISETNPVKDASNENKNADSDSAMDQTDTISKEMMAFMNFVQPEIKQIEVINKEVNFKSAEIQTLENVTGKGKEEQNSNLKLENLGKPEVNGNLMQKISESKIEIQLEEELKSVLSAGKNIQNEINPQQTKSAEIKPQETKPEMISSAKGAAISGELEKDAKLSSAQDKAVIKQEEQTEATQVDENLKNPEMTKTSEVIRVKVGDLQETKPADVVKQIAEKIHISNAGDNEYEIQLEPEQLGKIKVKVSFEQGQINVSLICSNGKTFNLLSENIAGLSQLIQDSTKTAVTVNVQDDNYTKDEQGQNGKQQQPQQNKQDGKDEQKSEFVDQFKLDLWEIEKLKRQYQLSSY